MNIPLFDHTWMLHFVLNLFDTLDDILNRENNRKFNSTKSTAILTSISDHHTFYNIDVLSLGLDVGSSEIRHCSVCSPECSSFL